MCATCTSHGPSVCAPAPCDPRLGEYSLITVLIKTDKGIVEMKYDEGFRGSDALKSTADFLSKYVGYAALIDRTLIELQDYGHS